MRQKTRIPIAIILVLTLLIFIAPFPAEAGPPPAPTNLRQLAVSGTGVTLQWDSVPVTVEGYRVYYAPEGVYTWTLAGTGTGPWIEFYSLTPDTNYSIIVKAYADSTESAASNMLSIHTLPVPAAPSGLTAIYNPTIVRVELAWADNSSNEEYFAVFRKVGGGSYGTYATTSANVPGFYDGDVTAGNTYYYKVRAALGTENSDYSNEVSITIPVTLLLPPLLPPVAPSNLVATPDLGGTAYTLQWDDNSSDETQFVLERKPEGGAFSVLANNPANDNNYSDTTMGPGTVYYYRVKAVSLGGDSAYSNEVSGSLPAVGSTPAAAPTGLTATFNPTLNQVDLTWTDNSSDENLFIFSRKVEGGSYTEYMGVALSGSAFDSSITPGTTYYYKVAARKYGAADSAFSNEASVMVPTTLPPASLPAAPTGLTASASSTGISLAWSDNSSDELGFKVERKSAGGTYTLLSNRPANAISFVDTSAAAGTTYTYRVLAFNAAGHSPYSNEAAASITSVTPPVVPPTATPGTKVIKLYIGKAEYYVNGELKTMDTVPVITEGRTLLPIRYVAEPLGATLAWDAADKKVTVIMGSKTIVVWVDRNTGLLNGTSVQIDPANPAVAPLIVPPGRTMLPLRFIAENLGCRVDWDPATQEVKITYPRP